MQGTIDFDGLLKGSIADQRITNYEQLTNKPKINGVELVGDKSTKNLNISYNDLQNKPTLFSGSYNDLSDKATLNGSVISGNMYTNNYSTEEKVVGKWIDEKPIYQKTFTKTLSSTNDYIDLISLDDIETFIGIVQGVARYSETTFNQDVIIPFYSSYYIRVYYISNALADLGNGYPNNQILFFESTSEGLKYYRKVIITIQYTKSTDNII